MPLFLFRGGRFLDPHKDTLQDGIEVLVEGDTVREVTDTPIRSESAQVIDLGSRTLMPGLIDNHVHMYYFVTAQVVAESSSDPQFGDQGVGLACQGGQQIPALLSCG